MEYDKRIMNTSLILDCFNTTFARKNGYKNKFGYFTDVISNFANLKQCYYGKLTKINNCAYQLDNYKWYTFFLPEGAIEPKKKEKKYRPYTLMEFTDKFTVGRPIKFRRKDAEGYERYLILNGYKHERYNDQTITYIYIGANAYTLQELFDEYEWQVHYTEDFEPFGVEE